MSATPHDPAYNLGALHGASAVMVFLTARGIQEKPLEVAIAEAMTQEGGASLKAVFELTNALIDVIRAKARPPATQ